jgi:c-di-GMP-binding flagellar brake protein YcgR
MRRDVDRRARARLDVVGAFWGTLETQKRAQVVDLNDTGALLLSPVHLPPNTVHTIELTHEGRQLSTEVLVRHVRPAQVAGTYHVGVEFLSHPLIPTLEV